MTHRDRMNIVFIGHVDHGKSTVVGRLLADTNSLPEGKLEQVKENCEKRSKPFEYAFLIDALKDEQSQGITIDAARVFFKTKKRDYIIFDAPGHIEFLKNMITGASHAEAALLVIDANEGVQENSRRHGYMASMLGIKQVAILVNKMDLINFDEKKFNNITNEYSIFLKDIEITPSCFIPVSGLTGDNIAPGINNIDWYEGKTVLDILDEFTSENEIENLPFRMPVQDIYKFTGFGDTRRIIAGTIQTGSVSEGDEIIFYPSGKKSTVKKFETFNAQDTAGESAPNAVGFTLAEQVYITRGELAVKATEKKPFMTSRFKASLFWLGKNPLELNKNYIIKIGTSKISAYIEKIHRSINASDLNHVEGNKVINRHEVAECTLKTIRAIPFDKAEENPLTGRFVIVDNYEITGGGIITEEIIDEQTWVREFVHMRNYKWELSSIPKENRSQKFNQSSALILITGKKDAGKKPIARALEQNLFDSGKMVFFLGMGNIIYGVDADIKGSDIENENTEHIRRLAEVAHIMLESGIILIVTAINLNETDKNIIKTVINEELIETVWVGNENKSDIDYDIKIEDPKNKKNAVELIKTHLIERKIIFIQD